MQNLIIINAGKFGREVYSWAKQAQGNGVNWQIKGFLDSRKDVLRGFNYEVPIIASPEVYLPEPGDLFVSAIGDPNISKHYCELLISKGAVFTNVIHPTVVMGKNIKIGIGVILCPYVIVSCDVTIGNFVSINFHGTIGHDVVIGDYCQISPHAVINGQSILKEAVSVGCNVAILPNMIIEEFAVIGAGSLVLSRVRAHQTVFGVPAKPLALPKHI